MSKVSYSKQLISFEEQISLLKERGMCVEDENKALHILQNVRYCQACCSNFIFVPGEKGLNSYLLS